MRNYFKPVLAIATLALAASTAWAPAASAAAKPASPVSRAASASVGTAVWLYPSSAWVHFLPTVESDHLTINQGDYISAVCREYSEGNYWDLVLDHDNGAIAGFTLESYLSQRATQFCGNAGTLSTQYTTAWVHLHPEADWEHQVVNPLDTVGALCSMSVYDPSDGSTQNWDLIVDHTSGLVGFTWDSVISSATPPTC